MAQRAYRQRKQSAIDILKQTVSELEKSREEISQEFINFTAVILRQNAVQHSPEVLNHIKKSTLSLLQSAEAVDGLRLLEDQVAEVLASESSEAVRSTDNQDSEMNMEPHFPMFEFPFQVHSAHSLDSTASLYLNPSWTPSLSDAHAQLGTPMSSTQSSGFNSRLPGASLASTLPSPRSYAAQEQTFGRRLLRASQEGGYLLASMKNPPPTWYMKVFGLCIRYESREEIRNRLGRAIGRFGNLSQEIETNSGVPPSGTMGPYGPTVEELRDMRLNAQLHLIDPEYAGDFFDSDEIEICLRGYGVRIPPRKDFVTAWIDTAMFEDAEDTEPADFQNIMPGIGSGASVAQTNHQDFATYQPQNMTGIENETMQRPTAPRLPKGRWKTPITRNTRVTVDVERLITCEYFGVTPWAQKC